MPVSRVQIDTYDAYRASLYKFPSKYFSVRMYGVREARRLAKEHEAKLLAKKQKTIGFGYRPGSTSKRNQSGLPGFSIHMVWNGQRYRPVMTYQFYEPTGKRTKKKVNRRISITIRPIEEAIDIGLKARRKAYSNFLEPTDKQLSDFIRRCKATIAQCETLNTELGAKVRSPIPPLHVSMRYGWPYIFSKPYDGSYQYNRSRSVRKHGYRGALKQAIEVLVDYGYPEPSAKQVRDFKSYFNWAIQSK